MTLVACASGCTNATPASSVQADYDKDTGKLRQLTVDIQKDGKPNIVSHMDGNKFVRIEIDRDEDGKTDRWEYYGADRKLEKVGFSRSNNGKPDAWAFEGKPGVLARMEIATKEDGKPNRNEYYEDGALTRADEDTDGDGRADKWETYENGRLATVSFDLTKSGHPTTTVDYRK